MRHVLALAALLLLPANVFAQKTSSVPKGGTASVLVTSGETVSRPTPESAALPPGQYALNLKGSLTDSNSNPVSDGVHTVLYNFYAGSDPAVFSSAVFFETQRVAVFTTPAVLPTQRDRKGKYSVTLGLDLNLPSPNPNPVPANPLNSSLFVNQTLWMEIFVDGQRSGPPQRQQILQIAADSVTGASMNQVIWVTNALDHIEMNHALETAALAYYIRQIYSPTITDPKTGIISPSPYAIPNADPNFVTRSLIRAQASFNQRYRSPQTGAFRFLMSPLDAITNMYGILIQQPGNPVTLPIIGESLTFSAGAITLGSGSNPQTYQQFSYELGRVASSATFNEYQATQMEQLYLLARTNKNAALVINTFFGFGYKANTADSLFTILAKNAPLAASMNFAPLAAQIEADGSMLTSADTTRANIVDFYDRMTMATHMATGAIGQITALQKSDYVGAATNTVTSQQIQAISAAANQQAAPMLTALNATNYVFGISLPSTAAYKQHLVDVASMRCAASAAKTAGDLLAVYGDAISLSPGSSFKVASDGLKAVGDGIDVVAAGLDVAAAKGDYSPTPTENLQSSMVQLGNQLGMIQTQIDNRAALTDSHIIAVYDQMNKSFSSLNDVMNKDFITVGNALDLLTSDVVTVQYKLDRLTQNFSDFEKELLRPPLVTSLGAINDWSSDPSNYRYTIPGFDYQGNMGACLTYITSTCTLSGENGNANAGSPVGDTDVLGLLDTDNEKNLNYLMAFVSHRFYLRDQAGDLALYTAPNHDPNPAKPFANPSSWEMACIGIMRAATIYPDLGLPYVQAGAFVAPYNIGASLQAGATSVVLQAAQDSGGQDIYIGGQQQFEKSPILKDMLLHQNLMAGTLYNDIVAEEAAYMTANPAAPALARYNDVSAKLSKVGSTLSNDANALDGSRRLLEQLCEFGLSRSVKTLTPLLSLLYSAGDPGFRDTSGVVVSDPNAQRLPDGALVRALYHNTVAAIPPAPPAPALNVSNNAASTLVSGGYYVIVTELVNNGGGVSESLPSPESVANPAAAAGSATPALSGKQLVVASPAAGSGLTGYKVYIGLASGGPYYLQNSGGTAIGTNYTITMPVLGALISPPLAQYDSYITADPKALFLLAQTERWNAMRLLINGEDSAGKPTGSGVLDRLAADATTNGLLLGEPLASVDAVQSRLAYFLIPSVSGTIKSYQNLNAPANQRAKSLASTVVTMQYSGARAAFTAPVILNAMGAYTIFVPIDNYSVLVRADGFLQASVGQVDTRSGNVFGASASLTVGDITGDNIINNSDLIFLRNALYSAKNVPGYNAIYDLNGDGVVDYKDAILLQGALFSKSGNRRWNPLCDLNGDGKVDGLDQIIFNKALNSTPASGNWNKFCDFNNDGVVDYHDLEILQGKVGTSPGSSNWNPLYQFVVGPITTYDTYLDPTPTAADMGTDGYLLNAALGTSASSPNWNPLADLNGDGVVDILDLQMLRSVFGARGQN